jgi:hypothetical protein
MCSGFLGGSFVFWFVHRRFGAEAVNFGFLLYFWLRSSQLLFFSAFSPTMFHRIGFWLGFFTFLGFLLHAKKFIFFFFRFSFFWVFLCRPFPLRLGFPSSQLFFLPVFVRLSVYCFWLLFVGFLCFYPSRHVSGPFLGCFPLLLFTT